MLVPPLTSWLMRSPYFFGAKRAAAHLRVSTRKRATLQFSCVAVSAISIHSLKNLSACASRARISQESPRRHWWHLKAEYLGDPEVDYQIEFGWPHHWQASGFLPMENAPGIDAALMLLHQDVDSIAHQTAHLPVG